MDKSTKSIIIVLSVIALIGVSIVSVLSGFVIGKKIQKRKDEAQMEIARENFKRLRDFKQGTIQSRSFGMIPRGAKGRLNDLKSKSLVGLVLEIQEEEDALWAVLSPIDINEAIWKVKIDSKTKVIKNGNNVDKEEIKEGSHIMVLGEKDFEESTIKAEVINLKIK